MIRRAVHRSSSSSRSPASSTRNLTILDDLGNQISSLRQGYDEGFAQFPVTQGRDDYVRVQQGTATVPTAATHSPSSVSAFCLATAGARGLEQNLNFTAVPLTARRSTVPGTGPGFGLDGSEWYLSAPAGANIYYFQIPSGLNGPLTASLDIDLRGVISTGVRPLADDL